MVTILLQTIIELLAGWKDSFFTWANEVGDKIAAIKTNTDSLPGIKADTADIKDNTAAVITPISNINTNVSAIAPDVASIKADTLVIKNNANAIMTSSGQTAAYAEDIADNTLDCSNRLVTIGSDTTQIRADSGSMAADVSEIKNTLGLYLYNTIVTEDAEGAIANFDTDLKDYLQNAVVTIPADAGGISECKVGYVDFNQLLENGNFIDTTGWTAGGGSISGSNNVCTFTASSPNNASNVRHGFPKKEGHLLYVGVTVKSSKAITLRITIGENYSDISAITTNADNFISTLIRTQDTYSNTNAFLYLNRNSLLSDNDTVEIKKFFVIDLTQAFGEKKANYLYALPDNGLSIIRQLFTKDYYPYNAGGSLVSVESVNGSYYPNADVSFGSSITDGGELDLVTGLLRVDTTPATYIQTTPAPIRTLKGLNSIWADCGDISVTYRETLKHYLEKQDSNSRSLNRNVNLLRENIESNVDSDRREI